MVVSLLVMKWSTAHCKLHTAHCTLHTAHCTLHTTGPEVPCWELQHLDWPGEGQTGVQGGGQDGVCGSMGDIHTGTLHVYTQVLYMCIHRYCTCVLRYCTWVHTGTVHMYTQVLYTCTHRYCKHVHSGGVQKISKNKYIYIFFRGVQQIFWWAFSSKIEKFEIFLNLRHPTGVPLWLSK